MSTLNVFGFDEDVEKRFFLWKTLKIFQMWKISYYRVLEIPIKCDFVGLNFFYQRLKADQID